MLTILAFAFTTAGLLLSTAVVATGARIERLEEAYALMIVCYVGAAVTVPWVLFGT